ncbi:hypothetical protein [Pseudostreptobacillus hongkongensis]|uniref:hypothetical protein n=1 Tax=Pseudostreptobacillus hongkongensis TaxID=1162717 RepID=UPI0008377C86|nr:hypothetical protein [Pseudostreptobacillus hongkongensis]
MRDLLKGLNKETKKYDLLKEDIMKYLYYFDYNVVGFGGVQYKINYPFSKTRAEHPFWLVEKMEFLFEIYKEVMNEIRKK